MILLGGWYRFPPGEKYELTFPEDIYGSDMATAVLGSMEKFDMVRAEWSVVACNRRVDAMVIIP